MNKKESQILIKVSDKLKTSFKLFCVKKGKSMKEVLVEFMQKTITGGQ